MILFTLRNYAQSGNSESQLRITVIAGVVPFLTYIKKRRPSRDTA